MSEASETRKKPEARSLRLPGPAVPLVRQRPAMPTEIPRAAMMFIRAAVAAQWHAQAFYALGWRTDSGGCLTGQLRASVLVRMKRGDERAVAVWATPWPVPPGIEPPGMDTPEELADHLPRGDLEARGQALRVRRLALLGMNAEVKWTYEHGTYWVRPAPPLGAREGSNGWWPATELKRAVTAPRADASASTAGSRAPSTNSISPPTSPDWATPALGG